MCFLSFEKARIILWLLLKNKTSVMVNCVIRDSAGVIFIAAKLLLLSLFFNFCILGKRSGSFLVHDLGRLQRVHLEGNLLVGFPD